MQKAKQQGTHWSQERAAWILAISLVGLWGVANASALRWLASTVQSAAAVNLGLALGAAGGMGFFLLRDRPLSGLKQQFLKRPHLQVWPLMVMVGAICSTIALKCWADIPQLEVALCVAGAYGLLGIVLAPSVWKSGWVSAVLVACVLPFSTQFQTGLGMPARIVTAHLVERAMHLWQFSAVSANDIIVLENGIAHVDLPCSGLKSLWTGSLFLLLVTLLERRQLGLRWLLAASGTIYALFWANAVRVFLLVFLAYGLNSRPFAEMLHVPLGLIGFSVSCLLGWLLLQWVPKRESDRVEDSRLEIAWRQGRESHVSGHSMSARWQMGIVAILAVLAVVSHSVHPLPSAAIAAVRLPAQLQTTALPLTPVETQFFKQSTFPIAEKWRFDWDGVSGSMLVVASYNWQAHHPPELCLAGNGFEVDGMTHQQIAEDLDARWLSLDDGALSATYWFQSPQGTTDDFMTRFVESITHRSTPWTMVSIVFDRPLAPTDEGVRGMTTAIRAAVADSFRSSHPAPIHLESEFVLSSESVLS